MTSCIRYGAKKIEKFFFVFSAIKMTFKVFWTRFDDFCFSRSANPLHDFMFWGLKVFKVGKSDTVL